MTPLRSRTPDGPAHLGHQDVVEPLDPRVVDIEEGDQVVPETVSVDPAGGDHRREVDPVLVSTEEGLEGGKGLAAKEPNVEASEGLELDLTFDELVILGVREEEVHCDPTSPEAVLAVPFESRSVRHVVRDATGQSTERHGSVSCANEDVDIDVDGLPALGRPFGARVKGMSERGPLGWMHGHYGRQGEPRLPGSRTI